MSSLRFFEILMIAVGMAMDAFAVSLGAGASGYARDGRAIFRLSFHFGLFQISRNARHCHYRQGRTPCRPGD